MSFPAGRRPSWTSRGSGKRLTSIVYSKLLETVSTRQTRLAREFDPQVVRHLKAQLPLDVAVGGPTLAAHAIRAGLVDEYHLFVAPVIIGSGNLSAGGRSLGKMMEQMLLVKRDDAAAAGRAAFATVTAEARKVLRFMVQHNRSRTGPAHRAEVRRSARLTATNAGAAAGGTAGAEGDGA